MNNPICLRKSFMRAKRTFEAGRLLLRMSGGNMDSQSLRMEKLLLTGWALKRKVTFMTLHRIMHSVLILFCYLTNRTDIFTGRVFFIRVGHLIIDIPSSHINFIPVST